MSNSAKIQDQTFSDEATLPPRTQSTIGKPQQKGTPWHFRSLASRVSGTGPNALRQNRIRAAAACLLLWWTVIFTQSLFGGLPWVGTTIVIVCLGTAFSVLTWKPDLSGPSLKAIELSMFLVVVLFFVTIQYAISMLALRDSDVHALELTIKNGMVNGITLLLAYTLLIPNSVRSASWMILLLALFPIATYYGIRFIRPEVVELAATNKRFQPVGLNLTMALVAAGMSMYGVYIMQTLRKEAFEAKRMNQYELGEAIGSGGMGQVYSATHQLLKRECALKLISPANAGDDKALVRLEREVQATAKCSHPNIVQVFDYGSAEDGTFYYVMEKLDGLTLEDVVRRFGPMPGSRVIYLMNQVCAGLAEAHLAGLVHRDLKPANIFAARVGRRHDVAKVLDFGIVKQVGAQWESGQPSEELNDSSANAGATDLTMVGEFAGTPSFASPEQFSGGDDIDHRADLYSLGAVAFFLLTGRPPVVGSDLVSIVSQHLSGEIPLPSTLADVAPDLEEVVMCCLSRSAKDRYPDADTLAEVLSSLQDAGKWGPEQARTWWQANAPA